MIYAGVNALVTLILPCSLRCESSISLAGTTQLGWQINWQRTFSSLQLCLVNQTQRILDPGLAVFFTMLSMLFALFMSRPVFTSSWNLLSNPIGRWLLHRLCPQLMLNWLLNSLKIASWLNTLSHPPFLQYSQLLTNFSLWNCLFLNLFLQLSLTLPFWASTVTLLFYSQFCFLLISHWSPTCPLQAHLFPSYFLTLETDILSIIKWLT